jgi:phage shock protein PspC (stress-responsive transcriptional regulator)
MDKKVYRSTDNKVIGGVCGGLGEYLEIDPNLVRVIAVVLFLATQGFVLPVYVVGWIIFPKRPPVGEEVEEPHTHQTSTWTRYLPGLILIFVGAALLIREHWFWFSFHEWWPLILIVIGLVLIFRRRDHKESVNDTAAHQSDLRNGGSIS